MNSYFSKTDVKILAQKSVYQGHFQLIRMTLRYRLFNGSWSRPFSREIFERGEGVGVLLFDPHDNHIVLIEQFRAPTILKTENSWLVEIVSGMIDTAEDPLDTAKRETQEETGLAVRNLCFISRYWVSPGASTERITLYCGQVDSRQAHGIHGLTDEGEDIRLQVLPLQEAYNLLNTEKINASTIIALLWLQQHEATLRKVWSE